MKKKKKKREKQGGKKKIRMKIVATTSLPAVDRPNADRWNAARSRQLYVVLGLECSWGGPSVFREHARTAREFFQLCCITNQTWKKPSYQILFLANAYNLGLRKVSSCLHIRLRLKM